MSIWRLVLLALLVSGIASASAPAQPVLGQSGPTPDSAAQSWGVRPAGESADAAVPVPLPDPGEGESGPRADRIADDGSAINPIAVPEPGALLLTGAAVAWAVGSFRRNRREPGM
jgi:hypothetical protein